MNALRSYDFFEVGTIYNKDKIKLCIFYESYLIIMPMGLSIQHNWT